MFKKKVTKQSLAELAKVMPVVPEWEMATMIGGTGSYSGSYDSSGFVDGSSGSVVSSSTYDVYSVGISVSRQYYGDSNSTASVFLATAYKNGIALCSISGCFLEPVTDWDRNTKSGSDTAIRSGEYSVEKSSYKGQTGYYEIKNVPGRSAIKIHAGNTGADTEGCLLPGKSINSYTSNGKTEYSVSDSTTMVRELFQFLNSYGSGGISMNIGV